MKLPPPRRRPKFAQWRYERGLTVRATADLLEAAAGYRVCSHENVRTICLPIGDPGRTVPSPDLAAAIAGLTEDDCGLGDWPPLVSEAA